MEFHVIPALASPPTPGGKEPGRSDKNVRVPQESNTESTECYTPRSARLPPYHSPVYCPRCT